MKTITAFQCSLVKQEIQIDQPISKIGGNPIFFNKANWPKCSFCGNNMDFIGQISLNEPVKFSSSSDIAYIFMCPGEYDENGLLKCETWNAQSGANMVILQKKTETIYKELHHYKISDYTLTFRKVMEPLVDFSDPEIDEKVKEKVVTTTKIGGIPAWLQDNETPNCPACGKPMQFIAQIDSELDGQLGADVSKWSPNNSLDFGGSGIGYLFLCGNERCDHTQGAFLWQCT